MEHVWRCMYDTRVIRAVDLSEIPTVSALIIESLYTGPYRIS